MFVNDAVIDERIKGFTYAFEPERVEAINDEEVHFHGRHTNHNLKRINNSWACDCAKYQLIAQSGYVSFCAHVIATEKVLESFSASRRAD